MKKIGSLISIWLLSSVPLFASHVPRGPAVVSETELTGQSGYITSSTLYTPDETALYRISVYLTIAGPSGCQTTNVGYKIDWTDEYHSASNNQGYPYGGVASSGQSFNQTFVVRATSGNAISLSTDIQGCGGDAYDIFVTIEKI